MCFRFGGKHKKEGTRKSKTQGTKNKVQERRRWDMTEIVMFYPSGKSSKSPQIVVQTLSLRHGTGVTTD